MNLVLLHSMLGRQLGTITASIVVRVESFESVYQGNWLIGILNEFILHE